MSPTSFTSGKCFNSPENEQEFEFNKYLEEIAQSNDKKMYELDAAFSLMSVQNNLLKFIKHIEHTGEKIKVTEKKYFKIQLAYRHYLNLIQSHVTMVIKDIQNDISEMYNLDIEDLIFVSNFGHAAFNVEN